MDKIYDKCCGVDVHKKLMVACFRQGRKQEIREFGATTRELLEMADWLKSGGCEMIAIPAPVPKPRTTLSPEERRERDRARSLAYYYAHADEMNARAKARRAAAKAAKLALAPV